MTTGQSAATEGSMGSSIALRPEERIRKGLDPAVADATLREVFWLLYERDEKPPIFYPVGDTPGAYRQIAHDGHGTTMTTTITVFRHPEHGTEIAAERFFTLTGAAEADVATPAARTACEAGYQSDLRVLADRLMAVAVTRDARTQLEATAALVPFPFGKARGGLS